MSVKIKNLYHNKQCNLKLVYTCISGRKSADLSTVCTTLEKKLLQRKILDKKKFSLNYFLIRDKLSTVPVKISDKSVTTQLPSVWRIFQLFKILQGLQSSSGIRLITSKGWLNAKRDGITNIL